VSAKIRSLVLAILALAGTVLIAIVPSVVPQVALAATTALIMGGAGHPLSPPPDRLGFVTRYRDVGVNQYIIPSGTVPDNVVVVITPEARLLGFGFDPFFTFKGIFDGPFDKAVATGQQNLDLCINGSTDCPYNQLASGQAPTANDSFIVYGYSQSSTIATLEKRALIEQYPNGGGPKVSFLLTANGNRPNGGILARGPEGLTIPIAGLTFSGPTPTESNYPTIDISRQYDGWSDQPTNPLNLLAELNAVFGMYYLHQNYDEVSLGQGVEQDQVGDTTYYLVPTPILPLLLPLDSVPVVGHALADTLDPFLRVLVEAGFDRTISPGTPTNWNLLYFPNPVALAGNLVEAVPTGLDNGLQDVTGDRPLGTERPGPYGVGGPPVNIDEQQQLSPQQPSGGPVGAAGVEDLPDPSLTQPVHTKQPLLTALNNGFTRTQAQGEVRESPLVGGGPLLLENAAGSNGQGTVALGSPLNAIRTAVQNTVEKVLKPKTAAADGGE
jgi:PE-PPE domain